MTKKSFCLLLCLCFLFSTCACGKQEQASFPNVKQETTHEQQTLEASAETTLASVPFSPKTSETTSKSTKAQQSTQKVESTFAPNQQENSKTTTLPKQEQAQEIESQTEKPTEEISLVEPPKPPEQVHPKKEIQVFCTIDCHNAIEWGILEKNPEMQKVLPSSGILFQDYVTVHEGDKALDVFLKAFKKAKLAYYVQNSSGYISSVAGLAERMCGAQSGWMYSVNGAFPNVSAKYCPVKNGDKLELLYTCKIGDLN